jgi:hypothetical protein
MLYRTPERCGRSTDFVCIPPFSGLATRARFGFKPHQGSPGTIEQVVRRRQGDEGALESLRLPDGGEKPTRGDDLLDAIVKPGGNPRLLHRSSEIASHSPGASNDLNLPHKANARSIGEVLESPIHSAESDGTRVAGRTSPPRSLAQTSVYDRCRTFTVIAHLSVKPGHTMEISLAAHAVLLLIEMAPGALKGWAKTTDFHGIAPCGLEVVRCRSVSMIRFEGIE